MGGSLQGEEPYYGRKPVYYGVVRQDSDAEKVQGTTDPQQADARDATQKIQIPVTESKIASQFGRRRILITATDPSPYAYPLLYVGAPITRTYTLFSSRLLEWTAPHHTGFPLSEMIDIRRIRYSITTTDQSGNFVTL
ncbi:hypothetical protein Y032_0029g2003 [Ancylostoma ceylanicum]|uniref:Uncharacterized protein n=1 Tax=Ancylostoma ceylanicum TaxID=53326 RepID=A0A016US41_9BILA|nr:hypothetical protein Y032_0029g2003 [Ancylostoma ceylanicum]